MPHELTHTHTQNHHFEVLPSPILRNNNESFFDRIAMCEKSRFYMTTSDDLKRSSKALLRAKLEPKEGHGHCLVACCPPDQLQLSECRLKHYIEVHSANWWDAPKTACSQHWSAEWAQFFPMTMPDRRSHNPHFKNWMNLTTKFCLICHIHLTSHQLTTTFSGISTSSCLQGKNTFTTSRRQKVLRSVESQSMGFYATGTNKLISHWQKMHWL